MEARRVASIRVRPLRAGVLFLATALAGSGASAQQRPEDVSSQHGGIGDSILLGLPRLSATPCTAGLSGIYPCSGVDLLSFVPAEEMSVEDTPHAVDDLWGWTDPETGREYALVALDSGVSFVDATNPESPTVVGYLPSHTTFDPSRDVKVYADHAFVVAGAPDHGVQVFDLRHLREVSQPPVRFEETAHYSGAGLAAAHNLAIDESSGFGYVTGSLTCGGGLHAVDLRSPQAPVFAGCADQDGYVHDAQCLSYAGPDAEFQGREVCFAFAEDTLSIFDVTDKAAPSLLARSSYPGVGYTHQGWTTEDGIFLLMGDEGDETLFGHDLRTYVWDVSRLRTPLLIGTHTSDVFATDHNRYVVGGLLYLSAYTGGFRVYDLAGVGETRLVELAYYDVVPGTEVASRLGAIGVYPYFPSGVVALTATRQGLFLLDVQAR